MISGSRRLVLYVLGLAFVNAALFVAERALVREEEKVERRLSQLGDAIEAQRRLSERTHRLDELLSLAGPRVPTAPLGIATLRKLLGTAERGLSLERISLEFRPESGLPEGIVGSQIQVSAKGALQDVYTYLGRVEALHLPLATRTFSLRPDGERLELGLRWSASWSTVPAAPELTPAQVDALTAWLRRPSPRPLGRDLFSYRSGSVLLEPAEENEATLAPPDLSEAHESVGEPEPADNQPALPELEGFVLSRAEIEPDPGRRVLVVLKFEDEVHLLGLGERVGPYVVEHIEARESVTLVDAATGEEIRLRLP